MAPVPADSPKLLRLRVKAATSAQGPGRPRTLPVGTCPGESVTVTQLWALLSGPGCGEPSAGRWRCEGIGLQPRRCQGGAPCWHSSGARLAAGHQSCCGLGQADPSGRQVSPEGGQMGQGGPGLWPLCDLVPPPCAGGTSCFLGGVLAWPAGPDVSPRPWP